MANPNKLANETSPYLLQHAHNPVHWYPWGDEALQKAKAEDKPILVSIGYSACHWCHVMERESFENEDIAALMNEYFINIKIDREERPDLDHFFMDALHLMSGSGGWPLNVFLTPDGKPFFGGTYFPPVNAYNRASWPQVLVSIHQSWKSRRSEIEESASDLVKNLQSGSQVPIVKLAGVEAAGKAIFSRESIVAIVSKLLSTADKQYGGFGRAPKFPQFHSIKFLLHSYHHIGNTEALQHAEASLQGMIKGGIYDQLAGGLARYSTDVKWLAPHFEKMLYDNALFVDALSEAFLVTKNPIYLSAIESTFNFLLSEMKAKEGGFFAALDADSEGEEGKFYTWQKQEIEKLLGENAIIFNSYFNVCEEGNWEHTNILHITTPRDEVAKSFRLSVEEFDDIIKKSVRLLLAHRQNRVKPQTDDKILLGWNALLITAFCKAYAATLNESFLIEAESLASFIESNMRSEAYLYFHTYKNKEAKIAAFADDLAYYAQALIHLQEVTSNFDYLHRANKVVDYLVQNFSDNSGLFFYYTSILNGDVLVRKVDIYDSATPAPNAVMAYNLYYLSIVFDKSSWRERAQKLIANTSELVAKYPASFGVWGRYLMSITFGLPEFTLIGANANSNVKKLLGNFIGERLVVSSKNVRSEGIFLGKTDNGQTMTYLCIDGQCQEPVSSVNTAINLLKNRG